MAISSADAGVPLCVDLDGTLLRTDSTWELIVLLVKHRPYLVFALPFWLMQGRSVLKQNVATVVSLDATILPYHETLLVFLREQQEAGRHLALVTGAAHAVAESVNAHLGLFHEVFSSNHSVNLTGKNKAALMVKRFGEKGFDYIGNAGVDMRVWRVARKAIVVNAPKRIRRAVGLLGNGEYEFADKCSVFYAFIRSIRPYQWIKNALIFVPLVTSHSLGDGIILREAIIAFGSFCFCTSSVYLLNDLLDLSSDRQHPRKKLRALSSGDLPIPVALGAVPILLLAGIFLALQLPQLFMGVLLSYFALTFAYSFYLKQLVLIDVIVLALLYTVRIIAGHAATGLAYSMWLLMFSMFFFFSLALVKRYSELESISRMQKQSVAGRGYIAADYEIVRILGGASGMLSILVLALYVTSDQVTQLYGIPEILWAVIPLMLYWITRIWLLAHRGEVHDDPVIFALKDPISYLAGSCIAVILFLAT